MTRLRIYGIAQDACVRALWMAKELGLDYEHIPIEIGARGRASPTRRCGSGASHAGRANGRRRRLPRMEG
jgi:hypothetical protein